MQSPNACPDWDDLEYWDLLLVEGPSPALLAHAATCEGCEQNLGDLRELSSGFDDIKQHPISQGVTENMSLSDDVLAQINAEAQEPLDAPDAHWASGQTSKPHFQVSWFKDLALAACVLLAIWGVTQLFPTTSAVDVTITGTAGMKLTQAQKMFVSTDAPVNLRTPFEIQTSLKQVATLKSNFTEFSMESQSHLAWNSGAEALLHNGAFKFISKKNAPNFKIVTPHGTFWGHGHLVVEALSKTAKEKTMPLLTKNKIKSTAVMAAVVVGGMFALETSAVQTEVKENSGIAVDSNGKVTRFQPVQGRHLDKLTGKNIGNDGK
jgi:hypothetical protein